MALAKAKLEEAKAKTTDEQEAKKTSKQETVEIGVAHENKATTKLTHREVDIRDNNGNVIGRAEEGSPEYVKLEMRRIDKNAEIEKAKARNSRPIIIENPNNNRNNQSGSQDSLSGSGGNR